MHEDVCENTFIMRKIQPEQLGKETKLKAGQSLTCCKSLGRVCMLWIRSLWQKSLLCLGTLTPLLLSTELSLTFSGSKLCPSLQPDCGPTHPPQPHLSQDEKWLLTLGMSIWWHSILSFPSKSQASFITRYMLFPGTAHSPGNFSVFLGRG